MSNFGKFYDSSPFIKSQGKTNAIPEDNVDKCIRQDLYFSPPNSTPEKVKKYRKSTREVPGKKQLHYGVYNDPKDHEELIHGIKSKHTDHVDQCLEAEKGGINKYINEFKEKIYASSKREGLGVPLQRNYEFPEKINDQNFRFGQPTQGLMNAKEVLYSSGNMSETPDVKKLYMKTHGITDPGEQKLRNYQWPINKETHIFGQVVTKEVDGTKKSLAHDFLSNQYPPTKITSKRVEDFRQATNHMLGISKAYGSVNPKIGENFCFGIKTNGLNDGWNVAKCLYGDGKNTKIELKSDNDLGKSVNSKSKILKDTPKPDPNRVYGTPSIKKGPLDQNDDMFNLLYPNPHSTKGLNDEDFDSVLSKEELKELLIKNNHQIKDQDYDIIFQVCLGNQPNPENKVSYKVFIDTIRNFKREYLKYRHLFN